SYIVSGTNTITNNFTVGNLTFAPNSELIIAPTGTLNVLTNYTSSDSGTLEYFAGSTNSPPRIIVGGTAFLDGALIIQFPDGTPVFGDQYAVISAGNFTGSFNSITLPNSDIFRGRGIIIDGIFYVLVAPTSYTQVALNQNQYNVAQALNSFISATSGDELVVSTALDHLTAAQYPNAFNQIMPALYSTFSTMAFNEANALNNNLIQRLGNLRVAGVGFSQCGFNDSPILDDNKNPKACKKDILTPSVDNHWGVFMDGNGIFANVNNNNQLPGYTIQSGGVALGANYKWNETFATGFYTGYQGTQSKQTAGTFVCDNASRFGLFGTYGYGGLFANAILGGDMHNYQVNRGIQFPGLSRTANSSPTAGELDSMLATGYDIKRGNFTFGPITSLQYTYFGLQPFTETGAQSLDLSVASANANSLIYTLGTRGFYSWQMNKKILVVPQINLGWQHEFLQNPYAINATFPNGAGFNYTTTTALRDSLYTGLGFSVNLAKKYDAFFFYNASCCNPTLVSQNFSISLGVKF
ncbi:MAG TPA: autotransporter domain-containing protein, partial [Chthoniobacterales bacterium]|nr:autotransporter domain-containing protein [Chthoniobacterales bacterium]